MLEGLDSVDWGSLTHAYGKATDVPELLRSLASADLKVRREAITALSRNIWHQCTVYPASAAAVPFLYELLTAPEVLDKPDIAQLLARIATGYGYFEVHAVGPGTIPENTRKVLARDGQSLNDELAREAEEISSVRRAASGGLRNLLPYLRNDDTRIRWWVAVALGKYPEHAAWSLPELESACQTEADEEAHQAQAVSIISLRQESGFIVHISESEVSVTSPEGAVQTIAWDELQLVGIFIQQTETYGLPVPLWVLAGDKQDKRVCVVPHGASRELGDRLRLLPGFQHSIAAEAVRWLDPRQFLVWQKISAAKQHLASVSGGTASI